MGFWEQNKDLLGGSGDYLNKDDKARLMEEGIPFTITGIHLDDNPFGDGQRFTLSVTLPDDEGEMVDRLMTFPKGGDHPVESRDTALLRMMAYLDEDPAAEPILVKLEKVGRSHILRPAAEVGA